jgi:hypothetical protein|tara:strand:- start:463 stop:927 length:465 start_codon:yes stop_codon:yes gene_type:complete
MVISYNWADADIQSNKTIISKLSKSVIGSIAEYFAVIKLLKKGYIVAKSVEPQALFDLIAVDPNKKKIKLIDVKTKSFRKKSNYEIKRCLNEKQKKLGVELMIIDLKKEKTEKQKFEDGTYKKLFKEILGYFPSPDQWKVILEKEKKNAKKNIR